MRKTRPVFAAVVLLAGCNSTCDSCSDRPVVTAGLAESADAGIAQPEAVPETMRQRPPPVAAPPDVSAPPADAQKTASGIAYSILTPGTGTVHPGRKDTVTVQQTGWTKSGDMIDSSVSRGQPITFEVDRVIRGWMEMLQLMVAGEKCRAWIPAALAYGDAKPGTVPFSQGGTPSGDLVYDIELISIQPTPAPDASAPASKGAPAFAGPSLQKAVVPFPAASTPKRN